MRKKRKKNAKNVKNHSNVRILEGIKSNAMVKKSKKIQFND
jgi:hypothetical protein